MDRLTQANIDQLLDSAETELCIFFQKQLTVAYRLDNGFVVCGSAGVINPELFNLEKGKAAARQDASNQLWKLEGYKTHGN